MPIVPVRIQFEDEDLSINIISRTLGELRKNRKLAMFNICVHERYKIHQDENYIFRTCFKEVIQHKN